MAPETGPDAGAGKGPSGPSEREGQGADAPSDEDRSPYRFAVITALGGLAFGVLLLVLVANNFGRGDPVDQPQGDTESGVFAAGDASVLADAIQRDGPVLLPDVSGGSRDIFLQHLGGTEWRAFESRPPGAPRNCVLRWEPRRQQFRDGCGSATYPADGTGLVTFPARTDDSGRVVVDLRNPTPPATTPPSTARVITDPPLTDPPVTTDPS